MSLQQLTHPYPQSNIEVLPSVTIINKQKPRKAINNIFIIQSFTSS